MRQYCTMMHHHMQLQLEQCNKKQNCIHRKVEQYFAIACWHWNGVKEKLLQLKPLFTSEIAYYCLIYHSLLFEPFGEKTANDFWTSEGVRLHKFEEENKEFISCYSNADSTAVILFPAQTLRG